MNAIAPSVIVAPGIYDMPAHRYHADPADTPSLSAGMITDLLCAPAKCRENSQRLNPAWEPPEGPDRFTLGTVSHILFLEQHLFNARVRVIDAPDWRTAAAKERRDDALAKGQVPILDKNAAQVWAARAAFQAHRFINQAFTGGQFEQSLFWRHPRYGFWCRARPDFLADSFRHVCDYKATGDANPQSFGRHAYQLGYHRRAAWYLDGVNALAGVLPQHYWFVNQEMKPPYLASVVELDDAAIEAGRLENDRACVLFDHCLQTADWFGYRHGSDISRDLAFRIGLPPWAHMQIEERTT